MGTVFYAGVIIPRLIFCLFPRRKLPRTYWPSSTWVVTHIAQSMFIVFMCPPSWVLEEMQHAKDTRRASSETLPLETSEIRSQTIAWLKFSFLHFVLTLYHRLLQALRSAYWRDSGVSPPRPLSPRRPAGWDRPGFAEAPSARHRRLWPVQTDSPAVPEPHQWDPNLPQWHLPASHRLQQQSVLRLLRVLLLHGGCAAHGRRL